MSLAQHPGALSMQSVSNEASKAAILIDHRRTAEVGRNRAPGFTPIQSPLPQLRQDRRPRIRGILRAIMQPTQPHYFPEQV